MIVERFALKNVTFYSVSIPTGRITFPAFKVFTLEFICTFGCIWTFLFWTFVLHSSTHLALGRLKGVSVGKHHLREHKILHSTKKRCGGGGEKTSEAFQKYLFLFCVPQL